MASQQQQRRSSFCSVAAFMKSSNGSIRRLATIRGRRILSPSPGYPSPSSSSQSTSTTMMITMSASKTNNDRDHDRGGNKTRRKNNSSSNNNNNNNNNKKMKTKALPKSQSQSQSVAIIGGGIAGLSCARHLLDLQQQQHQQQKKNKGPGEEGPVIGTVTVFDTGRLRPGGRVSSRHPKDYQSKEQQSSTPSILDSFKYDHAAQFITVPHRQDQDPKTWRNDFDQWIVNDLQRNNVIKLAPKNTIFNLNIRSDQDQDATGGDTNSKRTTTTVELQYESLQSSYDFYYPNDDDGKAGGMSSLVDMLVSPAGKGVNDNNNDVVEDDDKPSLLMEISTVEDDDTKDESNLKTKTTTFNSIPIDVRQDVWVSPSNGVKYMPETQQWRLFAKGKRLNPQHDYDHLIIAHNGKCADRLMGQTPSKQVHRLLRVNFNDHVMPEAKKMTLNSIYSYTICLESPSLLSEALPQDFIAGFVTTTTASSSSSSPESGDSQKAHPRIALITNQCPGKYSHNVKSGGKDVEVWTVFSTAPFAKEHKAPQEFLPEDVVSTVSDLLLDSLQSDIISPSSKSMSSSSHDDMVRHLKDQVLDQRLQLWGAGIPLNVWQCPTDDGESKKESNTGFLYDPEHTVGVCGDWLMDPSIAGAWTSGKRLAEHIVTSTSIGAGSSTTIGLDGGSFKASPSVQRFGIGSLLDVPDLPPDFSSNASTTSSKSGNKKKRRRHQSSKNSQGRKTER
eukprot:CAMPEP_0113444064 /NCGR_PEP_ID=MMETSP0014_2-20120614/2474_1 /TAXON_ID=2857 /ORGANISM="Nitzschia sp." /LENGTH=728 /DNA_ID=CAMNT_0000335065 /DNA_START=115 /DNA_END=2298 /DNA_ORIENTATION=+ /assembly_acc=CAM_ASM_000159